jgi:hypothetical protein
MESQQHPPKSALTPSADADGRAAMIKRHQELRARTGDSRWFITDLPPKLQTRARVEQAKGFITAFAAWRADALAAGDQRQVREAQAGLAESRAAFARCRSIASPALACRRRSRPHARRCRAAGGRSASRSSSGSDDSGGDVEPPGGRPQHDVTGGRRW